MPSPPVAAVADPLIMTPRLVTVVSAVPLCQTKMPYPGAVIAPSLVTVMSPLNDPHAGVSTKMPCVFMPFAVIAPLFLSITGPMPAFCTKMP